MQQDEISSDTIYLNVQALNNNSYNPASNSCIIDLQSNTIVEKLSDYNIYLNSLTVNTNELPYCNIFRNIIDPVNNVMNYSITLYDNMNNNSFVVPAGTANALPINPQGGGTSQGVCVFLIYESENNVNNPTSRSYFNVHSINQFMGLVNNALNQALSYWTNNTVQNLGTNYFKFEPITQYYNFICSNAFKDSTVDLYTNSFLEKILDSFRWIYYTTSIVPQPLADYTGMDYKFVKTNFIDNSFMLNGEEYWNYTAEFNALANLIDIHSIIIATDNGNLNSVRKQTIPIAQAQSNQNTTLNLPSISCLKQLDVDFSSLQLNSVNNCFLQFEASLNAFPINTLADTPLRNINIVLYIQTIDNQLYPLSLPNYGFCNIRLCLIRKKPNELKKK